MALTITQVDNRGDDSVPYGYVYFSDGSRIGYADFRLCGGEFTLFQSWGAPTEVHMSLMDERFEI